ncbi:MAG: hypothetical protein WCR49_12900, partial [Opitutae bacterium]
MAALAGEEDEVLAGEGNLVARHRAWSEQRADLLILGPAQAAVDRRRQAETARLERLGLALERDRSRHLKGLALKESARHLSAELYRLKGATGAVELLDGSWIQLPEGATTEAAVQTWFKTAKKAERGLARITELEAELGRERVAWAREEPAQDEPLAPTPAPARQREGGGAAKGKGKQRMEVEGKRKDGKGNAFRSVMVDGFEVLI